MAEVRFTVEAFDDLARLDGSVKPRVLKKILLLEENPEAGQPLGSVGGTNLTTFRKLVVGNRNWRIVYRIEGSGEVVVVWIVADREDKEVYLEAARRLGKNPRPEIVSNEEFLRRLQKHLGH